MAGTGPAPAESRRRRNVPARGDWVDLKPLTRCYLPDLPPVTDAGDPWREATKLAWAAWQKDPVTQMWSEADISYALDTILLHNEIAKTANEVRLRMDGLGLTPKGKRDHRWRIVEGDATETSPTAPKKKTRRAKRSDDRKTRLSVVK